MEGQALHLKDKLRPAKDLAQGWLMAAVASAQVAVLPLARGAVSGAVLFCQGHRDDRPGADPDRRPQETHPATGAMAPKGAFLG